MLQIMYRTFSIRFRRWLTQLTILKLMSHCFRLFATIGLFWQVTAISEIYFKYETKTAIVQSISGQIKPPNVCFCVRYTDIVFGKYDMKRASTLEERIVYQSKLTIKQIFEMTPDANESIVWCVYRSNDSISSVVTSQDCYKLFNVSKFYTQDLICYKMHPLIEASFLIDRVSKSLYFSHMMFGIRLSKRFNPSDKIHVIVHYDEFPWFSQNYAAITTRLDDFRKMTFRNNKYYVSFIWNKHYLLPAPFDTNCSDVPIRMSAECKKSCMLEYLIRINKIPASEFITRPYDLPHVNFHDLNDSATREHIVDSEEFCSSKCDRNFCYTDITSTIMDANVELEIRDQLITIWSRIPLSPVISVRSSEALTLVEFLTYIGGCLGTWLGLSILTFDPFDNRYVKHLRRRMTGKRITPIPRHRIHYGLPDKSSYWMFNNGVAIRKTNRT